MDTPGLADPESSDAVVHLEIIRAVADAAEQHPHASFAVLLVLSLACRIDAVVIDAFQALKARVFGIQMYEQSAVLYTHGDLLPEGDQSGASAMLTPAALAAATSVVSP